MENGVKGSAEPPQKRSVIFSNFISITLALAAMLLFLIVPQNRNAGGFTESLITVAVFLLPILLNRFKLTTLSRLYLCWVPPILITWAMILGMMSASAVPSSSYSGLRIYLLATSCIPYLLMERKDTFLFIAGILPNLLLILFHDYLLDQFGVGYSIKGVVDAGYSFVHARTLIAYVVIGGTCLSLRYIVHKNDELNQLLLDELDQKNKTILRQAAQEVSVLDQKLIKEQKQAQLTDAIFKSAFDHSAIGMALTAVDGKLLKANDHLSKITEYSIEELLAGRINDFSHPDEVAEDERLVGMCLRGEIETFEREKRHIRKSGSVGWIKIAASLVRQHDGSPLCFVRQIEDISERKIAEQEKERASYLLNERMKELTTLYRTGQILQNEVRPISELMKEIVNILPPGWQYPDVTAARIVIGDAEYKTDNFEKGTACQMAEFRLPHDVKGHVEVIYLTKQPQEAEGPFLAEERNLIDMIAEMLRIYFAKRQESMALKSSEANLAATINNTDTLIWSVDGNFRLIAINKPFTDYIKKHYGVDFKIGTKILEESKENNISSSVGMWESLYRRSLAGERLIQEEERFGMLFRYTIGPIIENDKITGVNVFATDITKQTKSSMELAEANKKIGELKLMALRSVMNPHFVFNVLSSIQFFIANNDRLNAINYLSTFSKLIRSILNHSVNNQVKISEELEMLKNYVQLERVRFDGKFDFFLDVDADLSVDDIEMPSLLVQPYVENAILHGLNNKEGKGVLRIKVSEEEDETILFVIEDDGIGREAALKLRQQNFPSHKSMGIKLTEERLKLINEHHNVSFEVTDLKDEKGPCGTKVKIWIKT